MFGDGWTEEKMEKAMEKVVKKALKEGVGAEFANYQFVSDKVSDEYIKEYCLKKGYHVPYTKRHVWKHEYEVFFILVPFNNVGEWVIKGTYYPDKNLPTVKKGRVTLLNGMTFDNVTWTGNVTNGNIDGKGIGGAYINKDSILLIDGTFKNGQMNGEVIYRFGTPNDKGYMRMGDRMAMNTKTKTFYDHGMYVNIKNCGEGIKTLEWAYYSYSENRHKMMKMVPRGQYGADYGSYWYFTDNDLNPLFKMPEGTFKFVKDFTNGYAIVKHCPEDQWNAASRSAIWVEYKVDRKGNFSLSDGEKTRMAEKYDYVMEQWDEMMGEFKQGFPKVCDAGFLPGMNVPERISNFDKYFSAYKLVNPVQEIRAIGKDFDKYVVYRQLVELFDIAYSDHSDHWDLSDNIARAERAYERTDFQYRGRFKLGKYIDFSWMSKRENRGLELISDLRANKKFNPQGKNASLDNIKNTITSLYQEYSAQVNGAMRKFNSTSDVVDTKAIWSGEQIDTKNSYSPSGLREHSSLLSTYYKYDKNGKIVFKTKSDWVEYNIRYKYDKTLDYYEIKSNSLDISILKQYSQEQDMMEDIIRAYNKKYPK
jgi:hypothetical protein